MIILSHTLQEFKVLGRHPEVTYQERIMEQFTCQVCGKEHNVLYVISRKISQQFGHFLAFKIAGEWQVVDPLCHMRLRPCQETPSVCQIG